MTLTIEGTLAQRQDTYGDYRDVSLMAQELKRVVRTRGGWHDLSPPMQESLDMICNKMARILNGNPYYADSWHDISGYATLVVKELGYE
jgi:hypothetical protein